MIIIKKIFLVVTAILIAFNLIMPPDVANANVITKPIAIAAKKAAKDLAKDSAVAMAEHIVFEKMMNDFLNSGVEDGYKPVCLSGKVDKVDDCPVDKRVQVKDLTESDKGKLGHTIENIIETKTNTSSKWGKFLDFFVPIFLISGLVAFIDSALDPDSESLMDEIAYEALIADGLIKPLGNQFIDGGYDFANYVRGVTVSRFNEPSLYSSEIILKLDVIENFSFSLINGSGNEQKISLPKNRSVTLSITLNGTFYTKDKKIGPEIYSVILTRTLDGGKYKDNYSVLNRLYLYRGALVESYKGADVDMKLLAYQQTTSFYNDFLSKQSDVNDVLNYYMAFINSEPGNNMTANLPRIPVSVKPDYGQEKGLDKIKDPNGKVPIRGVDSFEFTHGQDSVYPSDQSTTGWKDKTTGEDITVIEDDIVVTDNDAVLPPEDKPPGTDEDGLPPDKDKNKQKLEDESKKLGNLVTTRFPFSLPWDFIAMIKLLYAEPMTPQWEVRGTDKIPLNFDINLSFLDPYISWFRGFIMIGFVISVIFMHGRFMGGSQ